MNKLLPIFETITPDNIKNIKLIKDSMKIFVDVLEKYSSQSIDIKRVLDENTTSTIKNELAQIYLYDYYSMLQNLKSSKAIADKFKRWNDTLNPTIYPKGLPYIGELLFVNYFMVGQSGGPLSLTSESSDGLSNLFLNPFATKLQNLETGLLSHTPENYYANRIFKESKGLKKGIDYIYNILNEFFVEEDMRKSLVITENDKFSFNMRGSLDKDIYTESVGYLSHPLGFVYNYIYELDVNLSDDFSIIRYYDGTVVKVVCSSGNEEIYNKNVHTIIETASLRKVTFTDMSYLLEEGDTVKYFEGGELVKFYTESMHCSIYHDYVLKTKTRLEDVYHFTEQESVSDNYPKPTDVLESQLVEEFDFGMVIGDSQIVGTKPVRKDSDAVGVLGYNESLYSSNNLSAEDSLEIYETSTTEILGSSNDSMDISELSEILGLEVPGGADDAFNIMSLGEDFTIDLI